LIEHIQPVMRIRTSSEDRPSRHAPLEVLLVFLRLGCTSFGGPVAHLGYFQKEIVERRRWVSESVYSELIAIAHTLPGPGSSQVGFALGLLRAGWLGGLAAWVGFTLPSALLMLGFAYGHSLFHSAAGVRVLHGLQLVAVAVVAQAVWTMQRTLAPDRTRAAIAITATALVLFSPPGSATLVAIAAAAAAGLIVCRSGERSDASAATLFYHPVAGISCLVLYLALLITPLILLRFFAAPALALFSAFYRSGALVFGGGHVVLPLLENAVVARGWVAQPVFLSGYGAAQAMPGPLFSFSAFLGASVRPSPHPLLYGVTALLAIFLPGLLIMAAVLPFWNMLRSNILVQAALRGVNAGVVGILIAALYHPLWTSTVHSSVDFCVALAAFTLLTRFRVQPWIIVAGVVALALLPIGR
jgi:chromate transporter